jgi:ketosteroid isomerase-like protein
MECGLILRQLDVDEVDSAYGVYLEVFEWLKRKGINQWLVPIERREYQHRIERGETNTDGKRNTSRITMETKPSNESDPKETEQQFFSALIQSDHTALDRILTDDFILIDVMRGAEIDKAALLEVIQSGALRFEIIEPADVRLRLFGNAAIITGRTHMYGRFGDVPFTAHSRYTHVYIQQQSQWRLASAQGTPIEPDV